MNNVESIKLLRQEMIDKSCKVDHCPGVYRWWFSECSTKLLMGKLQFAEFDRLQKCEVEGKLYYALYFGVSRNLYKRVEWHVCQKHSLSSVKYGTLSTLRQTLSAMLGIDMSKSESQVNCFMDDNCLWEWKYTDNFKSIESEELSNEEYVYPLNIQENKTLGVEYIEKLKEMRKIHKK